MRYFQEQPSHRPIVIALGFALLAACNSAQWSAAGAAEVVAMSSASLAQQRDYELVGEAMPAQIIQLEALVSVRPDDDQLRIMLVQAYVGYAYGWLEVDLIEAEEEGDFAAIDALKQRLARMYGRARNLAQITLSKSHPELKQLAKLNPAALTQQLKKSIRISEDAKPLLWFAQAWLAQSAFDDALSVSEIWPSVQALASHVAQLHPRYLEGGAYRLLASAYAQLPVHLGQNLKQSKQLFQKAMQVSPPDALINIYQAAMSYAVATHNRALFERSMQRVLQQSTQSNHLALANTIAKRRAQLAWQQRSTLF